MKEEGKKEIWKTYSFTELRNPPEIKEKKEFSRELL